MNDLGSILQGLMKYFQPQQAAPTPMPQQLPQATPTPDPRNAIADLIRGGVSPQQAQQRVLGTQTSQQPRVQQVSPTPTQMPQATPMPQAGVGKYFQKPPSGQQYGRNPAVSRFSISDPIHQALQQAAGGDETLRNLLYDIAMQESSFRPEADPYSEGRGETYKQAGFPKGLFQFTDPTWETIKKYDAGSDTFNLPNNDRFDPLTSAMAAAYLIKNGQLGRWNASRNSWGPNYTLEEISPYYRQTQEQYRPQKGWKQG